MTLTFAKPFDLRGNTCRGLAIHYVYTRFGVDSSSRFPFRARTHRQTDTVTDGADHPTNAALAAVKLLMADVKKVPKHGFGHFRSLEKHADGTNRLAMSDFLLAFYSSDFVYVELLSNYQPLKSGEVYDLQEQQQQQELKEHRILSAPATSCMKDSSRLCAFRRVWDRTQPISRNRGVSP